MSMVELMTPKKAKNTTKIARNDRAKRPSKTVSRTYFFEGLRSAVTSVSKRSKSPKASKSKFAFCPETAVRTTGSENTLIA